MAVKKRNTDGQNKQLDLAVLVQYLELVNSVEPSYLPVQELIKQCQDLVTYLSKVRIDDFEQIWQEMQAVEDFVLRVFNTVGKDVQDEVVKAILETMYFIISDPHAEPVPATSVVLIMFAGAPEGELMDAAKWLVQAHQTDVPSAPGAGLPAVLGCLYRWLYKWKGTPGLPDFVLAYIKALEENNQMDILITVSVEHIDHIFLILESPWDVRENVAEVIFRTMSCLRHQPQFMEKIACYVYPVLDVLANDRGELSRELLQNSVDILADNVRYMRGTLRGTARAAFVERFGHIIFKLQQHMTAGMCRYLRNNAWLALNPVAFVEDRRRVGLMNSGNTCYMNSVIQALLLTRTFSDHTIQHMSGVAYWSRLSEVFAKLQYSVSGAVSPFELYQVVRPPSFELNKQHDGSEFLGYLFHLLHTYEKVPEDTFDYSDPIMGLYNSYSSNSGNASDAAGANLPSRNARRAASPRPGSSGGPSGLKRRAAENLSGPSRKFCRPNDNGNPLDGQTDDEIDVRTSSLIDQTFSGVVQTEMQCTDCLLTSVCHDAFRDLQLAFPEKVEGILSVQSLLDYYCSEERLSGDNMYSCPYCTRPREADRRVAIVYTPQYLILVLKNFRYDHKIQVQRKLLHRMHYNLTIHLPYQNLSYLKYHLYAAVVHSGSSLDSGHYYTIARDETGWYNYNDEVVTFSLTNEFDNMTTGCTPYILFYRRQDVIEPAKAKFNDLPPRVQQIVESHNKYISDPVTRNHIQ